MRWFFIIIGFLVVWLYAGGRFSYNPETADHLKKGCLGLVYTFFPEDAVEDIKDRVIDLFDKKRSRYQARRYSRRR